MGLAAPLCPLIFIIPNWATGQQVNILEAVLPGILFGVVLGYWSGGGDAFTRHFSLRWVLYRHGRIPLNYAGFLTEASEAGLLKQSGGRYRFYHDKLREHLASTIELKPEPFTDKNPEKWYSKSFFGFSIQNIGLLLSLALLLTTATSILKFNQDSVTAMSPVIQSADRIWFDRLTYPRWRSPDRYQVITFSTQDLRTQFPYELASRRIIALPWEKLEIRQGQLFLNGKLFKDDRLTLPPDFTQSPLTLGIDEYYVIGDNPNYDNLQTFGVVVPRDNITGQLMLRIYPFDRLGVIP
ncbi:signal peptidase I [Oxynema sp. CENA135]|uniref:signal peptidase I n=1 Tax=Oxynema sp. CENA135 TaxID=984206 RepID=UPI00190A3390|nr:signal peptidase I [Oxynema sp. CENA135]